jgi:hypothetical protein
MTVLAGAVGATFEIEDRASPVLRALMTQFLALQGAIDKTQEAMRSLAFPSGMNRSLATTETRMTAIADASKLTADATAASFAKVDTAAAATSANLARVAEEMRGIAAGSKAVNGSALQVGGSGGGRGGLWSRVTGAAGRVAGPLAGLVPPGLAGAAAAGYGLYEAFDLQDAATKILPTGQQPNTAEARQKIIDQITAFSQQTGFGPMQVAQATLESERVLAGLPFAERMNLEKNLMPSAGYEARMKGTTISEAQTALVSLSHMAGVYDPKGVEDIANKFAYASTVTNVPIGRFENSLSYSLPELHGAMGMDAGSVMLLTAMSQNAGILNTKSGTWIRSLFENANPAAGTTKHDESRNNALRQLGLEDAQGKSTWMIPGADGKVDWQASLLKFSEAMNHFTTTVTDPSKRIGIEKAAFGERGMAEAQIVAQDNFLKQLPQYQTQMDRFKGGAGGIADLESSSPLAQFYKTLADSEVMLATFGAAALPAAVAALQAFDAAVNGVTKLLSALTYDPGKAARDFVNAHTGGAMDKAGDWLNTPPPSLPSGNAIHSALTNRPGALANGGGPGDSFKGAVALPPPVSVNVAAPSVDVKATTTVSLDGASIAAAISTRIERMIHAAISSIGGGATNGDSGFDGREHPAYPDGFHGGGH